VVHLCFAFIQLRNNERRQAGAAFFPAHSSTAGVVNFFPLLDYCRGQENTEIMVGLSVHGSLQARILEWAAIPFSGGSSRPRDQTQVSSIAGILK